VHRPSDDEQLKALSTAMGQLASRLDTFVENVYGQATTAVLPKIVGKAECYKLLGDIWGFYSRKVNEFLESGLQDYLGKCLNDIFSVYTAYLGGHLSPPILGAQKKEIIEFWSKYEVDASHDLACLLRMYARAPITLVQDLGRLDKIVYPYDIDGTFAYIRRVKDIQDSNQRGKAKFTSDFEYDLEKETPKELTESEVAFRCAATVMIAVADARTVSSASLTPYQAKELSDEPYYS
jgi:hypothetical protein